MYLYYSRKYDTYLAHAYKIIFHIQDKYMLECSVKMFTCTQHYDSYRPQDMDNLKDFKNESSSDSISKVNAWLKENENAKESTVGDSSSVCEEKYKQKHIYIYIYMDKLYQNFETFLYKTACRKLSDIKVLK